MYPKFEDFWTFFFAGAWASIRQNSASEVITLEPICSKSQIEKRSKSGAEDNSKIGQENEEIRQQDHDLDLFWVLLGCYHF